MIKLVYAGKKEDEELELAPRVLRDVGPIIEDDLKADVGEAIVERQSLGRGLVVSVAPRSSDGDVERTVIERIGQTLLENMMNVVYDNPGGPIMTSSGQLVGGGRANGKRLGL